MVITIIITGNKPFWLFFNFLGSADSVASRLIKSLIPQGSVPSSAVVIAVSRICINKLSIGIKVLVYRNGQLGLSTETGTRQSCIKTNYVRLMYCSVNRENERVNVNQDTHQALYVRVLGDIMAQNRSWWDDPSWQTICFCMPSLEMMNWVIFMSDSIW